MTRKKSLTTRASKTTIEPKTANTAKTTNNKKASEQNLPAEHVSRVVIERLRPTVDGGKYPIKRSPGEKVRVEAILLSDGHDELKGSLLYRRLGQKSWQSVPLKAHFNDMWWAEFKIEAFVDYEYGVEATIDRFGTWSHDFIKRLQAQEAEELHLQMGVEILQSWLKLIKPKEDLSYLKDQIKELQNLYKGKKTQVKAFNKWLKQPRLQALSHSVKDNENLSVSDTLKVQVDPTYASFSAWYEFFPRSFGEKGGHGNFRSAVKMLDYVQDLGFDVVYLPPIHPIGEQYRKGKNNALVTEKNDVGSPWAIGSKVGGHKSIHPELGDFDDFAYFMKEARSRKLEVALDIAFQCSPDHPYVKEHPEWFKKRPDGSIQYAENPPKKYQDIYPIDFDSKDWKNLWIELKSVIEFWIEKGVKIFRVDNPHTKSFAFWKWAMAEIRKKSPEVIFLAEAFTRPHIMAHLAKIGYHQSYTYFTWRNNKVELQEYLTELSQSDKAEYFRPNFWPNTPDILAEAMQYSSLPHFKQRLILAATLTPNYGVYGPAYELVQNIPREPNKEEYLDSEKYQLRSWDLNSPHSLAPLMKRLNEIRRSEGAFRGLRNLRFHETRNEHLMAYSKLSEESPEEVVLVVVNLDPNNIQTGQLEISSERLGVSPGETFQVHDLLTEAKYTWQGEEHFIQLDPHKAPAHIFRIRGRLRSEMDFETYS